MGTTLNISMIIVSILLVVTVLLQQRGAGSSGLFGGDGGGVYRTKRGAEKIIFRATIILAVLFFGIALYSALFTV